MKAKYSLFPLAILIIATLVISLAGCSSSSTTPAATTSAPPPSSSAPAPVKTLPPTTAPASTAPVTSASPAPASTTPAVSVPPTPASAPTTSINLNIAAAASLTDVLKAIDDAYIKANSNITITPNFAGSGTLQTQIENGAPADVFISAGAKQMDNLQNEKGGSLILNDTRKDLLNNKVVLIVPNDSTLGLTNFSDLALDKVKKFAIGDPKSVPAGDYANQAFTELGITAKVQPKEVLGSDVRGVLTYVESGNVDAGIVYSTDALTSTKVKVVGSAPADINAKVVYPAAVIKASKVPDAAKAYLAFLSGDQAKALFEKAGFTVAAK